MAKRVSVIIDGSNFYYKLKNLGFGNLLKFNFSGFAKFLSGKNKIVSQKYYIGAVREVPRNPKSKKLLADLKRKNENSVGL